MPSTLHQPKHATVLSRDGVIAKLLLCGGSLVGQVPRRGVESLHPPFTFAMVDTAFGFHARAARRYLAAQRTPSTMRVALTDILPWLCAHNQPSGVTQGAKRLSRSRCPSRGHACCAVPAAAHPRYEDPCKEAAAIRAELDKHHIVVEEAAPRGGAAQSDVMCTRRNGPFASSATRTVWLSTPIHW